jgi:hypothetical protein
MKTTIAILLSCVFFIWLPLDSNARSLSDRNKNNDIYIPLPPTPTTDTLNISFYVPEGWDDATILSVTSGTNSHNVSIYDTDSLYLDWAVVNDGDVDISSFVVELSIDSVPVKTWLVTDLMVGHYRYHEDYSIGRLSAGSHTIGIKADALGEITEDDESDNSCHKTITVYDNNTILTFYRDSDGDGFGDPASPYQSKRLPSGYVMDNTDCNDLDNTINPHATEIDGDGVDQDCDGIDPLLPGDADEDGDGYSENQGDCNDSVATVYPGAPEVCGDGIDQDCGGNDALCPETFDTDGDGWESINGTVSYLGTPVCAMVLANGQFVFTCNQGDDFGKYALHAPLDDSGGITIQAFVSGLAPYRSRFDRTSTIDTDINLGAFDPTSTPPSITSHIVSDSSTPAGWERIAGSVSLDGSPLCAMVLANGQYMFSCGANDGVYDLTVPLDGNGQITLYVFVNGLQPYQEKLTP